MRTLLLKDNFTRRQFYFFVVYLYGYASNKDYRKTVPQIRAGEYEGLSEKVSVDTVFSSLTWEVRPQIYGKKKKNWNDVESLEEYCGFFVLVRNLAVQCGPGTIPDLMCGFTCSSFVLCHKTFS